MSYYLKTISIVLAISFRSVFMFRSGGRDSFRSCEAYDAGADRWTFISRMAQPRRNFAATYCGRQVFIFGGFDGIAGIFFDSEIYDERSGRWRTGPALPACMWNYAVAS
jgi:hypothetical protein